MKYESPSALEMAVKAAAKASPLDTNLAIRNFYYHRLLCRVFSEKNPSFVLKGGLGMLARTIDARATRDADLATYTLDIEEAVEELKRLSAIDLGDFVSFQFESMEPVRAEDEYREGYNVGFTAYLGARAIQKVSVDLVADAIPLRTPTSSIPQTGSRSMASSSATTPSTPLRALLRTRSRASLRSMTDAPPRE